MEIKVTIKSNIEDNLNEFKKLAGLVAQDAFNEFKNSTPVGDPSTWKSGKAPSSYVPGNAKRNTVMDSAISFTANYPYAERLDKGWSNQAPKGMIEPLLEKIPGIVTKRLNELNRGQQ